MVNRKILLWAIVPLIALHYGCSNFPWHNASEPAQKSNLTVEVVKTQIIKGKTTQAEILNIFGAPNIIKINSSNNEVWNYNRMSFKSVTRNVNNILLYWFGRSEKSKAMSTATTKSFDLIIIFDDNDVVIDYSVISAVF
jgi:hypothetical protein